MRVLKSMKCIFIKYEMNMNNIHIILYRYTFMMGLLWMTREIKEIALIKILAL